MFKNQDTIGRLIVIVALVLGACGSTTSIDQTWTASSAYRQQPMQNVVTMFKSDNVTMRHHGEDRLAYDLAKKGVRATPSYRIFGEQDPGDREAVKAKLSQLGYDGVVMMRIVDREEQTEYVPPTFDGYWGAGSYWGAGGGYAYSETIYRLETVAYSLRTGELMWSAMTRSVDPSGAGDLIDDTTKVIVAELTKQGLAG